MSKHNKKRNVGIIYELMLRHVSSKLIEGDNEGAQRALDLLSRSFDSSTEIYREFRLFNALANSTVTSPSVAATILSEARSAARRIDCKKLDREKSVLIKNINHNMGDHNFYRRNVPNYREYASIQNLLNEWRLEDKSDLAKTVQLESHLVDHLLSEKVEAKRIDDHVTPEVDSLVVKILSEKFNKKYGKDLSEEQKEIIREYVFSSESNPPRLTAFLNEVKGRTITEINNLEKTSKNSIVLEKISSVRERISSLNCEEVDDSTISRYLTVSQLKDTLLEAENEQQS